MARPKTDLPPADAIRALLDSEGRIALKVTPGARVEGIELGNRVLLVKVRSKPEDGKANAAVIALLAEALGVTRSRIELLRGQTGRDKLIRIAL